MSPPLSTTSVPRAAEAPKITRREKLPRGPRLSKRGAKALADEVRAVIDEAALRLYALEAKYCLTDDQGVHTLVLGSGLEAALRPFASDPEVLATLLPRSLPEALQPRSQEGRPLLVAATSCGRPQRQKSPEDCAEGIWGRQVSDVLSTMGFDDKNAFSRQVSWARQASGASTTSVAYGDEEASEVAQTFILDGQVGQACKQLSLVLNTPIGRTCLVAQSGDGPGLLLGDNMPARWATGVCILSAGDSRDIPGKSKPVLAREVVLEALQQMLKRTRSYGGARPLPKHILKRLQHEVQQSCGFATDSEGVYSFLQAMDDYFDDDDVTMAAKLLRSEFGLGPTRFNFEAAGTKVATGQS
mmetsp:Transcript_90848/g.229011  ORF Transcript_90848/g.229011 Transcript_90848/m.229011 type:complete len:357 (+) Transcript_90848:94-1164(+)